MALQDEILQQSKQIKTDSYKMSVGELLNLYRDKELDIHPEFQRVFRWEDEQKTSLIESMLLGIPIPPIFVAQRIDGVWDVVDGVQRISTIFQFVGELKNEEGKLVDPLVLNKTKFLPSLGGYSWSGSKPFSKDLQLYIKRAKIDVNIVQKESDQQAKYELFMRLNTGGSTLTGQEVRNCLMLMAYPETYEWVKSLSANPDFAAAVSLSEKDIREQYPMELVTRFLVFRNLPEDELKEVSDIGSYLNEAIDTLHMVAKKPKRRAAEEKAFCETFRILCEQLEDNAFKRFDPKKSKFMGGFSIASFEAIAMGVGFNIAADGTFPITEGSVVAKVQSVWSHKTFQDYSGSGVRASSRIPKIIPMGREIFAK